MVLPRVHTGFLQRFFITNAGNPIWNDGDVDLEALESASKNEQRKARPNPFEIELAADQLKAEDIPGLIEVVAAIDNRLVAGLAGFGETRQTGWPALERHLPFR